MRHDLPIVFAVINHFYRESFSQSLCLISLLILCLLHYTFVSLHVNPFYSPPLLSSTNSLFRPLFLFTSSSSSRSVGVSENVTNPSVTVAQAFRRRNIASLRNLAHQTQMAITNMGAMPETKGDDNPQVETPEGFPLMVQGELASNFILMCSGACFAS